MMRAVYICLGVTFAAAALGVGIVIVDLMGFVSYWLSVNFHIAEMQSITAFLVILVGGYCGNVVYSAKVRD
jgi:hypothetical protein